jgi:predicted nucleic acid-binding protein
LESPSDFQIRTAPFLHLSAVVAQELRAVNDVLLALSCREAGMVLVTANVRDFARIAKAARFNFVDAWP